MIETKEQYDEYNVSRDMEYSRNDWAVLWENDIRPTIEALREVARGAKDYTWGRTEDAKQLETLVNNLPHWITED